MPQHSKLCPNAIYKYMTIRYVKKFNRGVTNFFTLDKLYGYKYPVVNQSSEYNLS